MPRSFLHKRRNAIRRRGRRRAQQLVENPLASQDGRRARGVGRNAEDRCLRDDAAALFAIELDALERLAVNAADAVIARQRPIQKGEAAVDEVENAAILTKHSAR